MNQDCNTVARYVPLKDWRPKLHTKGCPFKELDTQVEVKHEMFWIFLRFYGYISCTFMYMLKRYVDVDDIWIYIYMVQFLESSKEGLLKNRRPSNNRISLKNRTVFFCRPGMSLKKYSFLRTSCPELFKENSQEDIFFMILLVVFSWKHTQYRMHLKISWHVVFVLRRDMVKKNCKKTGRSITEPEMPKHMTCMSTSQMKPFQSICFSSRA